MTWKNLEAARRLMRQMRIGDGCWEWNGPRNSKGYGHLQLRNKMYDAHRFSYMASRGEMPPNGLHVLHSCDNPSCVRPDHLRSGTNRENIREAHAKGRLYNPRTGRYGRA